MEVGHAFAISKAQRFDLARVEHAIELFVGHPDQRFPNLVVGCRGAAHQPAMASRDREKTTKKFFAFGTPSNGEEIEHLDEQARPSAARLPDAADELCESRDETIVPDSEEWTAGDVADTGRFHDDRPRRP